MARTRLKLAVLTLLVLSSLSYLFLNTPWRVDIGSIGQQAVIDRMDKELLRLGLVDSTSSENSISLSQQVDTANKEKANVSSETKTKEDRKSLAAFTSIQTKTVAVTDEAPASHPTIEGEKTMLEQNMNRSIKIKPNSKLEGKARDPAATNKSIVTIGGPAKERVKLENRTENDSVKGEGELKFPVIQIKGGGKEKHVNNKREQQISADEEEEEGEESDNDDDKDYEDNDEDNVDDNDDGDEDEDNDDGEEDISAMAEAEKTVVYGKTSKFEKYYNFPLLTSCEDHEWKSNGDIKPKFTSKKNSSLDPEDCRVMCAKMGFLYATLTRGICECYRINTARNIVNLESCDATCNVNTPTCKIHKKPHVISMRTGLRDGGTDWTVWMSIDNMNVKVRYRGCHRNKTSATNCNPIFERVPIEKESSVSSGHKTLIGCFSTYSLPLGNSMVKSLRSPDERSYTVCRSFCEEKRARYSVISLQRQRRTKLSACYCMNSLAQSRPSNSCPSFGAVVFFTSTNNHGLLKFDREVQKKGKVLVLARYRSGSSMTQSFFVRNPNPMILFEPGKMKATNVPSDRALLKGLEAFFRCDVKTLPQLFFGSKYLRFSMSMLRSRGQKDNNYYHVYQCYLARPKIDCGPIWQEICEKSSFLNVKTIRIFSAKAVSDFIARNPDVHVVHLVRDPRGLLAAQKVFGKRSPSTEICDQLVEVGKMVAEMKKKGYKNVHEVFYEQLAVNASFYGAQMYREMNIEMPVEVSSYLNGVTYGNMTRSKGVMTVVREDPTYHTYRFLERYGIQDLLKIDKSCREVYSFWPDHYADLITMYRRHKEDFIKYLPSRSKSRFHHYTKRSVGSH